MCKQSRSVVRPTLLGIHGQSVSEMFKKQREITRLRNCNRNTREIGQSGHFQSFLPPDVHVNEDITFQLVLYLFQGGWLVGGLDMNQQTNSICIPLQGAKVVYTHPLYHPAFP